MKRFLILLSFTTLLAPSLLAQHPFYTQLLKIGASTMSQQKWALASRRLEIAAFGLFEHPQLLAEAYMRLALVADQLKDQESVFTYSNKVNRVWPDSSSSPKGLPPRLWEDYQILVGLKAAPPPPLPNDVPGLEAYVKKNPGQVKGWLALIDLQLGKSQVSSLRKVFKKAMLAHPRSKEVLARALRFSVEKDKSKGAGDLAKELLVLDPNATIANEVLGNQAVKDKEYRKAFRYFSLVKKPIFTETPKLQRKLTAEIDKEKRLVESSRIEEERAANVKKAADAKRKKDATSKAKLARVNRTSRKNNEKDVHKMSKTEMPKRDSTKKGSKSATNHALVAAEAAVRLKPKDPAPKYVLLDLLLKEMTLKRASKVLVELGKTESSTALYAGYFARYNYLKKNYKRNTRKLSELRVMDEQTRYYLGMSYFRLRKYEKAESHLEGLDRQVYPSLIAVDRTLAKQLPKSRKTKKKDTSQQVKSQRDAHDARINTTLKKGSISDRLPIFKEMIDKGRWSVVRKSIKKALAEDPQNQDVLYYRARLYLNDGDFRRASNLFYNLVRSKYKKGEVHYYGGHAAQKDDPKLANYLFKHAIKEGSIHTEEIKRLLANRKSNFSITSKNIDARVKKLEEVNKTFSSVNLKLVLLRLYGVSGSTKKFGLIKKELKASDLRGEQADLVRAWHLTQLNNDKDALQTLSKYKGKEANFLRGFIYYRDGRRQEAKSLFAALKGDEDFPEISALLE